MTGQPITHRQARTLAAFIHELRGDFDRPGIEYALGQARGMAESFDLAHAMIEVARSAHNRSPAVIAYDGPHWRRATTPPRQQTPSKADTCSICYQRKDTCRDRWADDHDFQPLATGRRPAETRDQALESARAALTSSDVCAHGVPRTHCADHRSTPTAEEPA